MALYPIIWMMLEEMPLVSSHHMDDVRGPSFSPLPIIWMMLEVFLGILTHHMDDVRGPPSPPNPSYG